MVRQRYDLAVVGAGIVGLAHALAGARAGLSVIVVERDARAVGASIRNFGFVTVTGQQAGITWRRARRARDIWADVAPRAGIPVLHRGMFFAARRPEAATVLEEFAAGAMGEGCRVLRGADIAAPLRTDLAAVLESPHELRIEPRTAIPAIARWLAAECGVTIVAGTAVRGVEPGALDISPGRIAATRIVVCPGTDLKTLFPDVIARRDTTLCKLHMLRVAAPDFTLPGAVMSDLGLVRYLGYADCPSLPALRARLEAEQAEELANGIHLIAVQSADGSLVVGDSHHYGPAHDPFQPDHVDALILRELAAVLALPAPRVTERWIGLYPSGPEPAFIETVMPGVQLVMVTSGTGMSTAFAIAEETLAMDARQDA
jgi:FAD dependent oxidoreductase TIGR03364